MPAARPGGQVHELGSSSAASATPFGLPIPNILDLDNTSVPIQQQAEKTGGTLGQPTPGGCAFRGPGGYSKQQGATVRTYDHQVAVSPLPPFKAFIESGD